MVQYIYGCPRSGQTRSEPRVQAGSVLATQLEHGTGRKAQEPGERLPISAAKERGPGRAGDCARRGLLVETGGMEHETKRRSRQSGTHRGVGMLGILGTAIRTGSCFLLLAGMGAAMQGNSYYVAPSGNNGGSGSMAQPWRTVGYAIPRLKPGDTLFLRGGTYFERDISVDIAGTSAKPITIRNHPGETPVIDAGLAEFRKKSNQDWELFNGQKGIYRSKKKYPGADEAYGYFGKSDGSWRLVPYEEFGPLSTNNENYTESYPYFYCGPGVFWDKNDERIYVRLKHSKYEQPMGYNVPANTDPGKTPLFLFSDNDIFDIESSAAYLLIQGIHFRYGGTTLHFNKGSHHITVKDCDVLGGRYHILVRGGAHHLTFDGVRVPDTFPPWVARSDVKRPSNGRPAHLMQGSGINLSDAVDQIEIKNCEFYGLFDAIDCTGKPTNLRVTNNLFDTIRDDVMQMGTAGYDVEFAYNTIVRADMGVSWNGSGAAPPNKIGTKYIHHNIIDTSTYYLYGRSDPNGLLGSKWMGPNGDGMATGRPFGTHTKSAMTGPDPWKIYHNTIVGADDVDDRGTGHCYYFVNSSAAFPHEVYNNIFVQVDDHQIAREPRIHDGSQIYDGNLYFRSAQGAGTPMFKDVTNGSKEYDFASLAHFKNSNIWNKTQEFYGPGWESSGIEADPMLDSQYRPGKSGPAAFGAINLSSKAWPGLIGETHRGALPPSWNQAPSVYAGPDQVLPTSFTTELDGTVSDDGLPNPPGMVATEWTVISGPKMNLVKFGNKNEVDTSVKFFRRGTFVLRLTAFDGELTTTDEMKVVVSRGPIN